MRFRYTLRQISFTEPIPLTFVAEQVGFMRGYLLEKCVPLGIDVSEFFEMLEIVRKARNAGIAQATTQAIRQQRFFLRRYVNPGSVINQLCKVV